MPDNPDVPLDDKAKAKLDGIWESTNGPRSLQTLRSAAGIIGRAGREWTQPFSITLWRVDKMRSVLCDHRGGNARDAKLPGCVKLGISDDHEAESGNGGLLAHYWGRVTMFNTYGYVGASQMPSAAHKDRAVQMMPSDTALEYPQRALMYATTKGPRGRRAEWLEHKDLVTRGIWP